MDTLKYILDKYKINYDEKTKLPIEIPEMGRVGLAQLFNELGYREGAEIGVKEGDYSEVLCQENKNLKLYSIDPWLHYKEYTDIVSSLPRFYENAKTKLKKYNCVIIRKFSMEAVKRFEDGSLDFVFIDGNHDFQYVVNDICEWSKKVRKGGIVSGHDYVKFKNGKMHIVQALQGYTWSYGVKLLFLVGVKSQKENRLEDQVRSWFFVKS